MSSFEELFVHCGHTATVIETSTVLVDELRWMPSSKAIAYVDLAFGKCSKCHRHLGAYRPRNAKGIHCGEWVMMSKHQLETAKKATALNPSAVGIRAHGANWVYGSRINHPWTMGRVPVV